MYFHKIKPEYRNEKLLMLCVANQIQTRWIAKNDIFIQCKWTIS
jgi:hypothetical protein